MLTMAERNPQGRLVKDKPIAQLEITKELLEGFLYGKKPTQIVELQAKKTRKRKWEGVEDRSNRKIQSLWCEECCKHIQGECPIHQLSQTKITYAVGSFPSEVCLCTSSIPEYTHGACAAKQMPRGTWIGPYEGRRVLSTQIPKDKDNSYVWEIYENGQFSHFIDGSDESNSSWMRFIRCARHKAEQNMSVVQYGKNIYYYATRDIEIGDEMLVWYHESYYQFWGVPLMLAQELDEKNGPPVPPGILQPVQMETSLPSQPKGKPTKSPEVLQQHATQKSFQFPSKRHSPPAKLPYPPVSSQLIPKSDPSVSPVAPHPPPGVLFYPPVPPSSRQYPPRNVAPQYPGNTPYQPQSKSGIPYPPPPPPRNGNTIPYPPMVPTSASHSYPPHSRYPPTSPGTIQYQPTSTQYQVRPSQSVRTPFIDLQRPVLNAMGPPNVQLAAVSQMSPTSPPHPVPTSMQTLVATQIPQQLSPESRMLQDLSSRGPHAGQQAFTDGSHAGPQPNNHSPRAIQQLVTNSSRAEQLPTLASPLGQNLRAYEIDYTSRVVDRSSTESDQWVQTEVKENMPLNGATENTVTDPDFKTAKHLQAAKATPLQNLNPSIQNKRAMMSEADKQYNQVSSTVKSIKEQDISWTCGQCGEMFAQQVTLRMHVCQKEPEKPFHCGHCTNTFSTSTELREHVVTHSNERPFKCGFCGRSFAGATTLGNHMRTHTGQRPYECKVCGQTFAIATQLSRHLRPPGKCGLRQKEVNNPSHSVDIAVEQ